jgi:hypothetical protein
VPAPPFFDLPLFRLKSVRLPGSLYGRFGAMLQFFVKLLVHKSKSLLFGPHQYRLELYKGWTAPVNNLVTY